MSTTGWIFENFRFAPKVNSGCGVWVIEIIKFVVTYMVSYIFCMRGFVYGPQLVYCT